MTAMFVIRRWLHVIISAGHARPARRRPVMHAGSIILVISGRSILISLNVCLSNVSCCAVAFPPHILCLTGISD